MLKLVVLAILTVPSILAASTGEQIAGALIAAKDTGELGRTFQVLHKEHGDYHLSWALVGVVKQGHPKIAVTCLRTVQDLFPNDKTCVSELVHATLERISNGTPGNSESFVNVITSFKPTDVKPLASIRDVILWRDDSVNVLEIVMTIPPGFIIDSLPAWIASHSFDRNSRAYTHCQTALEKALQYLASFATQSVLEKALSIVKANEHYKVDSEDGPIVACCETQDDLPQDLVDKLSALLELVNVRNELVRSVLESSIPAVLLNLLADYITYEPIDYPISIPKTITCTKRKYYS